MLENYGDEGGCAASIIGLIGLIAFTICMLNAYPSDKECTEYTCRHRDSRCIEYVDSEGD